MQKKLNRWIRIGTVCTLVGGLGVYSISDGRQTVGIPEVCSVLFAIVGLTILVISLSMKAMAR